MPKILTAAVVCLVLFAAGAGGSMAYLKFLRPPADEESAHEDGAADALAAQGLTPVAAEEGHAANASPVAAAHTQMTAETLMRLSQSIRQRESSLEERQKSLSVQEERMKFALDDLQREQSEIEVLQQSIQVNLDRAGQMLQRLDQPSPTAPPASTASTGESAADKAAPAVEGANLKTVALWLKGVPPEQAAESIRQFSNDGKIELAARMLTLLEDRDAAKILAALNDSVLFNQLAERCQAIKKQK